MTRKPDKVGRFNDMSAEDKAKVEKMTNWERNQWARAGYPTDRVAEFYRPLAYALVRAWNSIDRRSA